MERAQALPASTSFFQPNVVAGNLDQVGRLANASDDVTVEVGVYHRDSFSHRGRGEYFGFRISDFGFADP
jgi:hypothetical protein